MPQIFISPQPNDPNEGFEGEEQIHNRDSRHDLLSTPFFTGNDLNNTIVSQTPVDVDAAQYKDGRLNDHDFGSDETA